MKRNSQRGITLLEMMIVTAIIALVAGLSFPSAAAGLEQMRLRSTGDSMVSFLNTAIDRAQRRQQVIEVWIAPQDGVLIARSPDLEFSRKLEVPAGFRISQIQPLASANPTQARRFLMYPGGTVPRLAIEIASLSNQNRRRYVSVDPLTGQPSAHAGRLP